MELLTERIENGLVYLGTSTNPYLALKECTSGTVTINNNTEIILENAFRDKTIGDLTLPLNLRKVGKDAFKGCTISNSLHYSGTIITWVRIDFENYYANPVTAFSSHKINEFGNDLNISSSLRLIKPYVFASYNINDINFAYSGENLEIQEDAFLNATISRTIQSGTWYRVKFKNIHSNPTYYSKNLYHDSGSSVTEVTSEALYGPQPVSDYAFVNLEHLTNVTLNNVTIIGHNTFTGCTNLNYYYEQNNTVIYLGPSDKVLFSAKNNESSAPVNFYDGVSVDAFTDRKGYIDAQKTILGKYDPSVEIANTTKFILKHAFKDSDISSVTIPDGVVFIGEGAFENCINLHSITIPNSVTRIDKDAFRGSGITEIYFGNGITDIPASVCMSCDNLQTVTFGSSVTNISEDAFAFCPQLTTVNFNQGLKSIQKEAFLHCTSLGNEFNNPLEIPGSVKYIGEKAFFGCINLKKINILCGTNTVIKEDAFACCFGMIEVYMEYLPDLLLGAPYYGYLGYYAAEVINNENDRGVLYENEDGLILYGQSLNDGVDISTATVVGYSGDKTSITIPDVKRIKPYAFYNQTDLINITFEDINNLQTVGNAAFEKCDKLKLIEYNGLYYLGSKTNPYAILVSCNKYKSKFSNVKINDQTKCICQGALSTIQSIKQLMTPLVGDRLITDSFNYDTYCSPLGNMFGKNAPVNSGYIIQELTYYEDLSYELYTSKYYIPNTLQDIIITKDNIISEGAFIGCNFKRIELRNLTSIDINIFNGCTALTDLVIQGNSLTSIPRNLLRGCGSLINLEVPFLGTSRTAATASADTLLGVIFGQTVYNGGVAVQQYFGSGSSDFITYYIPSTLKTVKVTDGAILAGAFDHCSMLTEITLPSAPMSSVDIYTFRDCNSLEKINNLEGDIINVDVIADYAFYLCQNLAVDQLVLNNLTSIGLNAFAGCEQINSILVNSSRLTSIGDSAFYNCSGLITLDINADNLSTIGTAAIQNCTQLKTLSIQSSSINSIPAALLNGCGSLITLTLPFIGANRTETTESATTVFGYIFGDTSYTGGVEISQWYHIDLFIPRFVNYYLPISLREVNILGGSFLWGAFSFCNMITTVTVNGDWTIIPNQAFAGCTNLSIITYPDTITQIGYEAFKDTAITSLILGPTVTFINEAAFEGCKQLKVVDISETSITTLIEGTFNGCTNLTTVFIPDTLTSIGARVFMDCASLVSINLSDVASTLTTLETQAFAGCNNLALGNLSLTAADVSIGRNCFQNCNKLISVSITSASWIGDRAFADCIKLNKVDIIGSASSCEFEGLLFENCTNLITLNITSNLITTLYVSIVDGCTNLETVSIIGSGFTSLPSGLLSGCGKLKNLVIPFVGSEPNPSTASASSLFGYIFGTNSYDGGVMVSQPYSSIGQSAVYYIPHALASVTINGGLLQYGAFYGCSMIQEIILPPALISLSDKVFYECSSLVNITIPNTVTSIGKYTFNSCSSLEAITIPNSVASIGTTAFANCTSLTQFIIAQNSALTSLPMMFLSGCGSLEEIRLPFVGLSKTAYSASADTLFGAIFGVLSYENSIEKTQSYSSSGSIKYYFPANLVKVTIDGGNVLYGAFDQCDFITDLVFTNLVGARFGDRACYLCSGLTEITLPSSITVIGKEAFCSCTNLEKATATGVTSIDQSAFKFSGIVNFNGGVFPFLFLTNITLADQCFGNVGATVAFITNLNSHAFNALGLPDDPGSNIQTVYIQGSVISGLSNLPNLYELHVDVGAKLYENCLMGSSNVACVYFTGTGAEWQSTALSNWDNQCSVRTVYCSDGYYSKSGSTWTWHANA